MVKTMDQIVEKIIYLQTMSAKMKKAPAKGVTKFVNKLVQKLNADDIYDLPTKKSEIPKIDNSNLFSTKKLLTWKVGLATLMARHFSCALIQSSDHEFDKKIFHYKLIGRVKDIKNAKVLFFKLVSLIENASKRIEIKENKLSFCEGMVAAVRLSLTNIKHSVKSDVLDHGNHEDLYFLNNRVNEANKTADKLNATESIKVHTSKLLNQKYFDKGVDAGYVVFNDLSVIKLAKDIIN